MTKPVRTSIQIRKADQEIYHKVSQFNFSGFISDMLNKYGQDYVDVKLAKLNSLNDQK